MNKIDKTESIRLSIKLNFYTIPPPNVDGLWKKVGELDNKFTGSGVTKIRIMVYFG